VSANIHGQPLDLPAKEKELLNLGKVSDWLRQFESHITYALGNIEDGDEKRNYENLKQAINFTLNYGDWITWKEKENLVIAPMSAKRAARSLFRCAGRVLFMSFAVELLQNGVPLEASRPLRSLMQSGSRDGKTGSTR
jgi:ArsR family metal-binding transcriptional regulator